MNSAVDMFEAASRCVPHRDVKTKKCKVLLLGSWKNWSQDNIPLPFLTKSNYLDMLGVKLFNNYSTTKKENGEIIVSTIKNICDRWKSGKFMEFNDRSISANTFALSKIWYKTSSIDLRKGDIEKITSGLKSWLYQDMLVKPEEEILHRKIKDGGLGLFHIPSKIVANFVTSFIQTAVNPNVSRNIYHEYLYNFHVLDVGVKTPRYNPYFPPAFFTMIKDAYLEGKDVIDMKISDWYTRLLERNITHSWDQESSSWTLKQSRIEYLFPQVDHGTSIKNIRRSSLPVRVSSVLLKLKLDLLPTQERLFRCNLVSSNRCKLCSRVDHQGHFLICHRNPLKKVCEAVIDLFKESDDFVSLENIVHMNISAEDSIVFSLGWILATVTDHIYTRKAGEVPQLEVLICTFKHNLTTFKKFSAQTKYNHIIRHLSLLINMFDM